MWFLKLFITAKQMRRQLLKTFLGNNYIDFYRFILSFLFEIYTKLKLFCLYQLNKVDTIFIQNCVCFASFLPGIEHLPQQKAQFQIFTFANMLYVNL